MARSLEPLVWFPFSVGGMVSAMCMPVCIVLTGIAVPMGWLSAAQLHDAVAHPLGRIFLFVLVSTSFLHWAHRFRCTLRDMGLKKLDPVIFLLCYVVAVGATICAALLAWRL